MLGKDEPDALRRPSNVCLPPLWPGAGVVPVPGPRPSPCRLRQLAPENPRGVLRVHAVEVGKLPFQAVHARISWVDRPLSPCLRERRAARTTFVEKRGRGAGRPYGRSPSRYAGTGRRQARKQTRADSITRGGRFFAFLTGPDRLSASPRGPSCVTSRCDRRLPVLDCQRLYTSSCCAAGRVAAGLVVVTWSVTGCR
jgi:hypothetical protein